MLLIDRNIITAENRASVLAVQRPIIPEKVLPKSSLILAMSLVLGGMVGVIFILFHNAITK